MEEREIALTDVQASRHFLTQMFILCYDVEGFAENLSNFELRLASHEKSS